MRPGSAGSATPSSSPRTRRTTVGAGSFSAMHEGARLIRPPLAPPALGDPVGVRVLQRSLGSSVLWERVQERRDPFGEPPEHRVGERDGPFEPGAANQLDRLVDGGIACDSVDERELIRAESQRRPDRSVETRDPAAAQELDGVVERAYALHSSVRETLRESAIALVEVARCSTKSAVGVRLVLEDAQQHRERSRAGRAYGRRPRRHASYVIRRPPSGWTSTGSNDPSPATWARQIVRLRPWSSARAPMCGESARTRSTSSTAGRSRSS